MNAQPASSAVQLARLRQFVEQVDARLLSLVADAEVEADSARAAEIARLERLRNLALQALDKAEPAA